MPKSISQKYFAMEVLEGDKWFLNMIIDKLDNIQMAELLAREEFAEQYLQKVGYSREKLKEQRSIAFLKRSYDIAKQSVTEKTEKAKKENVFR